MVVATSTEVQTEAREVYELRQSRTSGHRSYLSPDHRWVLIVRRGDETSEFGRCLVVPFDGKGATEVGVPGVPCTGAAWSPDGRWMYLELLGAGLSAHIWRERFPDGRPEQITSGPTVEHGIAVAPDGKSFITSVGSTRFSVWVHDAKGDRPLSSEGMGWLDQDSFASDGNRVYYMLLAPGRLWVADLSTGSNEEVFPGLTGLVSYAISRDGRFAALVRSDEPGGTRELWIGALDRTSAPRRIEPVDGDHAVFGPRHNLYFVKKAPGGVKAVYRIDYETGHQEEAVAGPVDDLNAVSPSGDWAVVALSQPRPWFTVARPIPAARPAAETGHRGDVPLCGSCYVGWSQDRRSFLVWYSAPGRGLKLFTLPLPPGEIFPEIFASAPRTEAEVSAALPGMPGATTIVGQVRPGPTPGVYQRTSERTRCATCTASRFRDRRARRLAPNLDPRSNFVPRPLVKAL